MNNIPDRILLAHGSGGTQTHELIRNLFARHFSNPALDALGDSAIVAMPHSKLAFTTDSYVVKPLRFPGGDIGKLAVCGTINDLAVTGARPAYLTAGFIIEEGLPFLLLEEIVKSMASTAHMAGVMIVAGDTKVVERGGCDQIFITTSGIGELIAQRPLSPSHIRPGDAVLINGPIADHGVAIMATRKELSIESSIVSDCAPLNTLVEKLLRAVPETRFMRDATRGGLAAVLNETVDCQKFGIEIDEDSIPLNNGTAAACEILGIDPLNVANEGKLVAVVPQASVEAALSAMRQDPYGLRSCVIGRAVVENAGKVCMATAIGTKRIVAMPSGEQLPRIC